MPYIGSDGNMLQTRPFGVALIMDYFWRSVNFVNLFFRSMFHMDDPSTTRGQYGNAARGPGVPGRRMGGFGRTSGVAAPPACFGGS